MKIFDQDFRVLAAGSYRCLHCGDDFDRRNAIAHARSRNCTSRNCGECLVNLVEIVRLDENGRCPKCGGADYGADLRGTGKGIVAGNARFEIGSAGER